MINNNNNNKTSVALPFTILEDLMEILTSFDNYTNTWSSTTLRNTMSNYTDIPIIISCIYIAMILWGPLYIIKPYSVRPILALWNLIIAIFSIIGAYYTVPYLIKQYSNSLYVSICGDESRVYAEGKVGFWLAAFILSKIPEMIDTVFLIIQKKPVIFLHWYHHFTVMLYCWHAYVVVSSTGLWFAVMNYVVHSIMYTYYFLMAINCRFVKKIAGIITFLQIMQMVVGVVVTVLSLYWMNMDGVGCRSDAANARIGLVMYGSYFVLFAQLFRKLYFGKKKDNDRTVYISKKVLKKIE
eukprot:Tbor_TRINITY_DN5382_c5_g1::TRINITY_DN5382_c5_g1_i1::g.4249::m.4249/K10203/ELOVL6; elongation of very long chain fatty acids protein 6